MDNIEFSNMTLQDFEKIKDNLISDFDDFWSPQILKSELIGENKKYIVAKQNEQIVGFAGVLLNIDEAEILNIVTKKEMRQKGIGTLLLKKIMEICKKENIQKIFLEVNEKNAEAVKLYEKACFEKISTRRKYYNSRDDAIIMMNCNFQKN